jgi:secondary thiamine-phosphate synthase enzyme
MALKVVTKSFEVGSRGEDDMIDITGDVREAVDSGKLSNGTATIFVLGSTAAVTTIEFEPGLAKDFPRALERIVPKDATYEHEKRWHDGNGHSHVKASLIGPSLTVPVSGGNLALGEWQQLVVVEFDTRPRTRKVVVQLIGE